MNSKYCLEHFPRYPRWVNYLVAHLNAFFWLPCPMCGKRFAGYESARSGLMTSWGGGQMVCWRCEAEADWQTKLFIAKNPPPPVEVGGGQ